MSSRDTERMDLRQLLDAIKRSELATCKLVSYAETVKPVSLPDVVTHEAISVVLGCHVRTVQKWLSGARRFPVAERRLLAMVAFGGRYVS